MRGRGHTLLEVMVVMALLSLLYALLLYTVVQVSQVSRRSSLAAHQQIQVMKTSEQLRWQLRCLYSEKDPQPGNTTTNSTAANTTAANATLPTRLRVGLIGEPGTSVLGQRGNGDGRDILLFITAYPKGVTGVVEVGYKLSDDGNSDLLYRQFAVRDVGGFHSPQEQTEGPWTPLLRKVRQFAVDYSADGKVWQRDWELPTAPRRVRIHLETQAGEVIDFQVTPAIGAGRW